MRRRLRNQGFPILVLVSLIVSGYLAATAHVPDPVPSFALQAAAVYRLEVGGACFAAFYLAAMALVLALDGRGFAELGTRGLRAAEPSRQ